ncbi:hypothetical protein [Gemmatimonas groenlandica]|uniref:Urease accessory protein UreH-like transmembrane domain-containing protein n=1 Tax=Gemmatimonas groenlandica TaxID=2732249 RepID=A0A6M4IX78_9BACT|nr:hypothetical protein [Gemmatimonas groenlandica]QJR37502.1 hypothetical protein HKW67_19285 [Gemmatimonas groenlandica]
MSGVLLVALSGIGAGCLHAISGPDHIAAILPLAVAAQQRAVVVGASWGLGHASGAGLVGAAAIVIGQRFPIATISMVAERAVGVLLIILGIWGLMQLRARTHPTRHDHRHESRAAMHVGLFHGIAGSAQLVGVLPSLFIPTLAGKLLFLSAFGAGSAASMALFAHLAGTTRAVVHHRILLGGSSMLSVVIGVGWIALAA